MTDLDLHWLSNKDWWHYIDEGGGKRVLNDDAPEEAKESYRIYLKQMADIDRRTGRWLVIPKGQTGWEWYDNHGLSWSRSERGSYSNAHVSVKKIPYKEFVIIREKILNYMEEITECDWCNNLNLKQVKKLIIFTQPYKEQVPVFFSGLLEAEQYGVEIEFLEVHIL